MESTTIPTKTDILRLPSGVYAICEIAEVEEGDTDNHHRQIDQLVRRVNAGTGWMFSPIQFRFFRVVEETPYSAAGQLELARSWVAGTHCD